jgi:hypothetical protein
MRAKSIQELEKEDSDMTNSDSNADKASHFQFKDEEPSTGFQTIQLEEDCDEALLIQRATLHDIPRVPFEQAMVLHQAFEKRNAKVAFKQNHGKKIVLDLKNVMFFNSQSTMDRSYNPKLINNMTKTSENMRLKSNVLAP